MVGFVISALNEPIMRAYNDYMQKAMQEAADANGYALTYKLTSSDGDVNKEFSNIQDRIASGCDVVIINAIDNVASPAVVQECRDNGVKSIFLCREADGNADTSEFPDTTVNMDSNCLYVPSDSQYSSCSKALSRANKWFQRGEESHVYIAGTDVFPDGYVAIATGYQETSTEKPVWLNAVKAAECTIALANGEGLAGVVYGSVDSFGGGASGAFCIICCLQKSRFTTSKPPISAIASDTKFIRYRTTSLNQRFLKDCLASNLTLYMGAAGARRETDFHAYHEKTLYIVAHPCAATQQTRLLCRPGPPPTVSNNFYHAD